jgi:CheY-like chemotaxis protein
MVKCVLLIDVSGNHAGLYRALIEPHGYVVVPADGPQAAGVILLDHDGSAAAIVELVRTLRRRPELASTPIVIVAVFATLNELGVDRGLFAELLVKPVVPVALLNALARQLGPAAG